MLTLRQWFHKHPELSFEEVKTAAKVVETLRGYGIEEVYEHVGKVSVHVYCMRCMYITDMYSYYVYYCRIVLSCILLLLLLLCIRSL